MLNFVAKSQADGYSTAADTMIKDTLHFLEADFSKNRF